MFAAQVKKEVVVGDYTVVIRKLSAKSLEKASEAKQIHVAQFSEQIGADLVRAIQESARENRGPRVEVPEDPKARFVAYDRDAVLVAGISSWSGPNVPGLPDGISDLDADSAQKLFEEILELSLPAVGPKAEEAEKNGSGRSINS